MNFYFKHYLNVIVLIIKFQIIFPEEDEYKEIDTSLRILGGSDVTEPYPYMVSLQVGRYGHYCGGSLIHQDWVLTAAHCLYEGKQKWFQGLSCRLVIGILDLRAVKNDTIVRQCAEVKQHSGFTQGKIHNDIAMIKVDKPVTNWEYMPLACYSTTEDAIYNRAECTVIGWGRTGGGSLEISYTLREVEVNLASSQKCRNHLGIQSRFTNLCTFSEGHSACKGDSGGPLMYEGEQIGIVSYGKLCNNQMDKKPGSYCRVDYYQKFIKATIASSHKFSSNYFVILFIIFVHTYYVI